ncbi:aromatic-ring-hydroxylating dioxygenase subunit beta [Nocardioides sp. LHD-245]|uniref:aromatic-ring-hydroxylating dioxygenase subunit beta n=1 Tax=Nocardioides sp. LHD-245 TaxID=3051387 RepID=UPI0027E0BAAF|nr:aromatic-ring-hydroxylating dioxygenase subunit beta [Nocardioides sp. LHD-245]
MVQATLTDERLTRVAPGTRAGLEDFLYDEAELLDQWRLIEWLDLFTPQAHYLVPSTDKPDADPSRHLFLVQDDRFLLEQRVNSLLTRAAHAEYPHSRTRRAVTNVRAFHDPDGLVRLEANFSVVRVRNAALDTYVGRYRHVLEEASDTAVGYRFVERKAILDLDALRPHGKVSIIL